MNNFTKDSRTECKYGEKCYQKNPDHHKRFRHPSKPVEEQAKQPEEEPILCPPNKKLKRCDSEEKDNCKEDSVAKEEDEFTDEPDLTDDELIVSTSEQTREECIKQRFLVDMPRDFYDFWDFCKSLSKEHPENALKTIGLKLVGAFDLLSKSFKSTSNERVSHFLCHWRFYYDPPEFQTVIVGDGNEYHIGYFRDDPSEDPIFAASMSDLKPGIIQPLKEDLFSSLYLYVNSKSCKADITKKNELLKKMKSFAERSNYNLTQTSDRLKERKKKVVAKSFHGAGIVVPVDKETDVGYREIPETDADLKRILKKIAEAPTKEKKDEHFEVLQELLTNAQWATDEGDFGMGLELGIDLFTFGCEDLHKCILHLLTVAYDLLDRKPFTKIIKAHLRNRRKGSNMSTFEKNRK